jgi:hypothetical protein
MEWLLLVRFGTRYESFNSLHSSYGAQHLYAVAHTARIGVLKDPEMSAPRHSILTKRHKFPLRATAVEFWVSMGDMERLRGATGVG